MIIYNGQYADYDDEPRDKEEQERERSGYEEMMVDMWREEKVNEGDDKNRRR